MDQPRQIWTTLSLTDGQDVPVDARAYPILMEWDWDFEPKSAQAVRSDGSGTRLYDEQIRLLAHAPVDFYPTLDRAALRSLFGGLRAYADALRLSTAQRDPVLAEIGVFLPPATGLVAHILSVVLASYHRWQSLPTRLAFFPDDVLPGRFEAVEDKPHYAILGDWLDGECTGRWLVDRRAPSGLVPEPMYFEAIRLAMREWRNGVRAVNMHGAKPKEVRRLLQHVDLRVEDLLALVVKTIGTYRL